MLPYTPGMREGRGEHRAFNYVVLTLRREGGRGGREGVSE